MTLTTHAIAGAALASLIPEHPVLGFCAGFASHFALDAIPHWDYPIYSRSINPNFGGVLRFDTTLLRDFFDIGFDAAFGTVLSLLLFASSPTLVAISAGLIGGMMPDFLQFVYLRLPHEPLVSLQRFHHWIHSSRDLRREGLFFIGILSQLALVIGIVTAVKLLA